MSEDPVEGLRADFQALRVGDDSIQTKENTDPCSNPCLTAPVRLERPRTVKDLQEKKYYVLLLVPQGPYVGSILHIPFLVG